MTKLNFLALFLVAILMFSCSKDDSIDYTDTENLSGTIWKSNDQTDDDVEYWLLNFTSSQTVRMGSKDVDQSGEIYLQPSDYRISGNQIEIDEVDGDSIYIHYGTIEEESIVLQSWQGKDVTFTLQE